MALFKVTNFTIMVMFITINMMKPSEAGITPSKSEMSEKLLTVAGSSVSNTKTQNVNDVAGSSVSNTKTQNVNDVAGILESITKTQNVNDNQKMKPKSSSAKIKNKRAKVTEVKSWPNDETPLYDAPSSADHDYGTLYPGAKAYQRRRTFENQQRERDLEKIYRHI